MASAELPEGKPVRELLGEVPVVAVQVGVTGLELARRGDAAGDDQLLPAGGVPCDLGLQAVGEGLPLLLVPGTGQVSARIAPHPLRHVGVPPHGLRSGRGPARVSGGHLPGQHERAGGYPAGGDLRRVVGHLVQAGRDVDGACPGHLGGQPRHRLPQRPVHLERRVVPVEPAHVIAQPGRQLIPAHQAPVHAGRGHGGQHGPPRGDLFAGRRAHRDRPPVADHDLAYRIAIAEDPAALGQPPYQGGGELARPAFGYRPAALMAEHGQQPSVQRAAGRFGHQVRVQGAAGQQQGARSGEFLLDQPADGQQREAREPQQSRAAQVRGQRTARADRRERHEQRVEQVRAQPLPQPVQPPPRRPVPGAERLQPRGRAHQVAREHRRAPAGQRVGEDVLGVGPPQPVPFEVQGPHGPGGGGQREERAAVVIAEAGRGSRPATHGAAWFGLFLADHHPPPGVGQDVRRDQPVRAGADHYRVRGHRRASASWRHAGRRPARCGRPRWSASRRTPRGGRGRTSGTPRADGPAR